MATQQFFPIREISAYHSRWTIRAKVTMKSQLRTFRRGNGEGKVFHVELHDKEGGEIRASFFNQAVDAFMDKLVVGKVYRFSRGTAKIANRQYNPCNHRYELTFEKESVVEEDHGEEIEATVNFSFSNLRSIGERALPCRVDICGIVVEARPMTELQSKLGNPLVKRDLIVADDTGTTMEVTLWGDRAKMDSASFEGNPILGLKGVNVKEWNGGRGGSLGDGGALVIDPKVPEAERLRQWWTQGGSSNSLASISADRSSLGSGARLQDAKVLNIAELKSRAERVGEQTEILTTVSRLLNVQLLKQGEPQQVWYDACAELKPGTSWPCNKRLDMDGVCPSCGRRGKAAVRLMARCRFSDFSDTTWFTCFHEAAAGAFGKTADEVKAIDQEKGEGKSELEAALQSQYFARPLQLTLRAKLDHYNGEVRTNVTCNNARPVSYREHGRKMLSEVREMLAVM